MPTSIICRHIWKNELRKLGFNASFLNICDSLKTLIKQNARIRKGTAINEAHQLNAMEKAEGEVNLIGSGEGEETVLRSETRKSMTGRGNGLETLSWKKLCRYLCILPTIKVYSETQGQLLTNDNQIKRKRR
jgi:hypothetical protein